MQQYECISSALCQGRKPDLKAIHQVIPFILHSGKDNTVQIDQWLPGTELGRTDYKVQHKGILEAVKVFWLDSGHGYTSLGICQTQRTQNWKE